MGWTLGIEQHDDTPRQDHKVMLALHSFVFNLKAPFRGGFCVVETLTSLLPVGSLFLSTCLKQMGWHPTGNILTFEGQVQNASLNIKS